MLSRINRKDTRLECYKVIAIPMLLCSSEAWDPEKKHLIRNVLEIHEMCNVIKYNRKDTRLECYRVIAVPMLLCSSGAWEETPN